MSRAMRWSAALLTLSLVACTGEEAPAPAPAPPPAATTPAPEPVVQTPAPQMSPARLDLAIELAIAIKANPQAGGELLAAKDMTQEGFEALLYEVAKDPGAAAIYTERTGL